jgi:uncharacterized protein (DUF736 family)
MIIGYFVSNPEGDRFQGELGHPFPPSPVTIDPAVKAKEGEPDCQVLTHSQGGHFYEIGAAWKRTSRNGKAYLSVKLDSPMFPAPVNAALFHDKGDDYRLVWTREERKQPEATAAA